MSRAIFAAGAVLASVSLARAGDHATFSPSLNEAPTVAAASPSPVVTAEAPRPGRRRAATRRVRFARGARSARIAAVTALKPSIAEGSPAVATIDAPAANASGPSAGNTEAASRTPGPPPVPTPDGPREEASGTVEQLLAKHAQANGVPLRLAQAVVRIESRGNVRASNHGALGLMQIKYGTARAAGFGGSAVGLFVADTNLRYGMKILGEAYKAAGGDTCGALMRYQSGHLATHMNRSNRAYCSRARAIMAGA